MTKSQTQANGISKITKDMENEESMKNEETAKDTRYARNGCNAEECAPTICETVMGSGKRCASADGTIDHQPEKCPLDPRITAYLEKVQKIRQSKRNSELHRIGLCLRGKFGLVGDVLEGTPLINHTDCIHYYTGTHYKLAEEADLRNFLIEAAIRCGVPSDVAVYRLFADKIVKQFLINAARHNSSVAAPDASYINLKNGTLFFDGRENHFEKHSPLRFCATAPRFGNMSPASCPESRPASTVLWSIAPAATSFEERRKKWRS